MKVNGYKIQQRLKELNQLRDALATQFNNSVSQYADAANKVNPTEVMDQYGVVEDKIARLQVAQNYFNQMAKVFVVDETMSLLEAVKVVGGVGRTESMWRKAAIDVLPYGYAVRTVEHILPERQVATDVCLEKAKLYSRLGAAYRQAIQTGNAQEIDIPFRRFQHP